MKIKKICKKEFSKEDIIMYLFNNFNGKALSELIPSEYGVLLNKYEEIRKERSKTKDLPGQLTFFDEVKN